MIEFQGKILCQTMVEAVICMMCVWQKRTSALC